MSRSYWRYIAAVVGWLILSGAVLFSIYPEQPHLTGNSGYQKEQIGYRAGGYDCQPAQIDKLPDTKRASRAVSCQEAKEQHRLQANDLIQQRRAADAAEASAIFAFQQTRIGAWGVVVGLTTLMAAIAAAYYARHAALETRRTADFAEESIRHAKHSAFISNRGIQAAKDGNRIAERSAREQLRPYVFVSSALIMRGPALDDPMRIRIKITNYGATPARDLRVKMNWAVLPHPLPHPFDDTQLVDQGVSYDVAPTQETHVSLVMKPEVSAGQLAKIEMGEMAIYLKVAFTYTDGYRSRLGKTTIMATHTDMFSEGIFMAISEPQASQ